MPASACGARRCRTSYCGATLPTRNMPDGSFAHSRTCVTAPTRPATYDACHCHADASNGTTPLSSSQPRSGTGRSFTLTGGTVGLAVSCASQTVLVGSRERQTLRVWLVADEHPARPARVDRDDKRLRAVTRSAVLPAAQVAPRDPITSGVRLAEQTGQTLRRRRPEVPF